MVRPRLKRLDLPFAPYKQSGAARQASCQAKVISVGEALQIEQDAIHVRLRCGRAIVARSEQWPG